MFQSRSQLFYYGSCYNATYSFRDNNISSGILIFCKYCLIITRDFQRRFQTSKFFENLKIFVFFPRDPFYARLCLTQTKKADHDFISIWEYFIRDQIMTFDPKLIRLNDVKPEQSRNNDVPEQCCSNNLENAISNQQNKKMVYRQVEKGNFESFKIMKFLKFLKFLFFQMVYITSINPCDFCFNVQNVRMSI